MRVRDGQNHGRWGIRSLNFPYPFIQPATIGIGSNHYQVRIRPALIPQVSQIIAKLLNDSAVPPYCTPPVELHRNVTIVGKTLHQHPNYLTVGVIFTKQGNFTHQSHPG